MFAALLGCTAPTFAQDALPSAAPAGEQWYAVQLDGRKIGQLVQRRRVSGDRVETEQALRIELQRNGQPLHVVARQTMLETTAGQPLEFSNRLDLGGSTVDIAGEVVAGVAQVRIDQGGSQFQQSIDWPDGAVLAEGQRLATELGGTVAGSRYRFQQFDLDALRAMAVEVEVLGMQNVALPDGDEQLLAVRQTMRVDGTTMTSELWLDPNDFSTRRMRMPMLGSHIDALACAPACASADNQHSDLLLATSVDAPRTLGAREQKRRLRYTLAFEGSAAPPTLEAVPGQTLSAQATGWQVDVDPRGDAASPPRDDDLQPSRWLQSDAPELTALATEMVGPARSAIDKMRRLERGVAGHIATKSLRVGYASALEAAQMREGDCTEHALLLAALGRAAGVPTRVASGLAYVPRLADRESLFVPHAWVYAWIDDRWQGFDAALDGYDAGHLALDVGDGDPFAFYAGLDLLGRLQITSIEQPR